MDRDLVIEKIAGKTRSNSNWLNNNSRQRRHGLYDEFGSEYDMVGDKGTNGRAWIAITPDVDKFVRWEFKLIVQSFVSSVAGNGVSTETLTIHDTELEASTASGTNPVDVNITPNPHGHNITPNPHGHMVTAGVTLTPSTFTNFKISIDGIDMTTILSEQFPLPTGNGVYPDVSIVNRYDIIEACSYLEEEDRNKILSAGYHEIQINADGIFNCKLVNFINYSFINRDGKTNTDDPSGIGDHGNINSINQNTWVDANGNQAGNLPAGSIGNPSSLPPGATAANLDGLVGVQVGNGQCGALSSWWINELTGGQSPIMGYATAWQAFLGTDWSHLGFQVIYPTSVADLQAGDTFFVNDTNVYPTGHTGVIGSINSDGTVTTYEQNILNATYVQKLTSPNNSWGWYGFQGVVRPVSNSRKSKNINDLKIEKYNMIRKPKLYKSSISLNKIKLDLKKVEEEFMNNEYSSNSERVISELKLRSDYINLTQKLNHLNKINNMKRRMSDEL